MNSIRISPAGPSDALRAATRPSARVEIEITRRLHHCRDLGEAEPFDFLTWFEFAKASTSAFDKLLAEQRATPEWAFVEREVEIRVVRTQP